MTAIFQKSKYKFSIIIGHHNQWQYLPQLAEALNNQIFRDFEIHFCDDGSTENFGKNETINRAFYLNLHPLLQQHTHIHRQAYKGMRLAKNVNQGIAKAQGEYCVFIMADSFPEHDYLAVFAQYAKPERVLNGVRYQVIDGKGVDVDWRLKKQYIPPMNVVLPIKPFNMTTGNGLVVPTKAFRKLGMWNEKLEGYGGDDNELIARLYYNGYIIWSIVDAKLFHNWHKPLENNPDNFKIISKLAEQYAS